MTSSAQVHLSTALDRRTLANTSGMVDVTLPSVAPAETAIEEQTGGLWHPDAAWNAIATNAQSEGLHTVKPTVRLAASIAKPTRRVAGA